MIRNIVFDIGNVLVDFCWREHIAGFGFDAAMVERLGRAMMLHPVWNEIDRGAWSNEELLAAFIANDREMAQEIRLVFSDLRTVVKEREGSAAWIRGLKAAGYGVYYLSNFSARVKEEAKAELSFLEEMDGGIMSYTVRLTKPDPAIYRALFARYDLDPKESVFLDDTPVNIRAAQALGMHTVLVSCQEQAAADLRRLLENGSL